MNREAKLKFIVDVIYAAFVAALAVLALKYLVWWLLPLVLGFVIAFALRPIVNAVYRLSSATRRFCAAMVLLCAYAALGALVWLAVVQLVSGLHGLFLSLPQLYENAISPALAALNTQVTALLERFFPALGAQFTTLSQLLAEQTGVVISSASEHLLAGMGGFVRGIPAFMLTFLFTILSSFFISMDYNNVVSFFARLLPKRHRKTLFALKDFLVKTVFRYLRAYLLLMTITFAEVWAGLAMLRVPSSGWWALGIAAADLLPAIGTGLVLLPWALFAFLQGNQFLGVGLLAVYGVITVVRNIIEPKIVGDNIGLPPLATITAMFFGLKLFGAAGLFLAPILVLMLKFLHDSGRIHLWDAPQKPK